MRLVEAIRNMAAMQAILDEVNRRPLVNTGPTAKPLLTNGKAALV
jgi:hypothetical protein